MLSVQEELDQFLARHRGFFEYLIEWRRSLAPVSLRDLTADGTGPARVAIASVDLIKGFTVTGMLASPRIAAIAPNVADLFRRAYDGGVRAFVLLQDAHPEDSLQFESYGPHCTAGTVEAETANELASLPFASEFIVMPKRTLSAAIGTGLDRWIEERERLTSVIVVGDCTDLCVYQLAMHLKMRSVDLARPIDVIVPEDCVQTYDVPVDAARQRGLTPHEGDLLHLVFLYHMALNSIRVVSTITA